MPRSFAGALKAILAIGRFKNPQKNPIRDKVLRKPDPKDENGTTASSHDQSLTDHDPPSPPLSFSRGFKDARTKTTTESIKKLHLLASRPDLPYFKPLTENDTCWYLNPTTTQTDLYSITHHQASTLLSLQGHPPDYFFNSLDPLPLLEIGVFIRLCAAKLSLVPDAEIYQKLVERLSTSRLILKNSLEKARRIRLLRETLEVIIEGFELAASCCAGGNYQLTEKERVSLREAMVNLSKDLEPRRLPQGKDRVLGPAPKPLKMGKRNEADELREVLVTLREAVQRFLDEAKPDQGKPKTRQEFITLTVDVSS